MTINQRFWQHLPTKLYRAKYVFPVPAKAAVCGFEMTLEDGTVVIAEAKEKEEARRDHEAAISRGYTTGLVEHVTDDGEFLSCSHCMLASDVDRSLLYVSWGSSSAGNNPNTHHGGSHNRFPL